MSIVTNLLAKLGLFAAMRQKINNLSPRLAVGPSIVPWLRIGRGWSSTTLAEKFQREIQAHKAMNELQSRMPVAR